MKTALLSQMLLFQISLYEFISKSYSSLVCGRYLGSISPKKTVFISITIDIYIYIAIVSYYNRVYDCSHLTRLTLS